MDKALLQGILKEYKNEVKISWQGNIVTLSSAEMKSRYATIEIKNGGLEVKPSFKTKAKSLPPRLAVNKSLVKHMLDTLVDDLTLPEAYANAIRL